MPRKQGAQDHDAPLLGEQPGRGQPALLQDKRRQSLEGKDAQPCVAGEPAAGQQLTFQLEGRLFGGQEQKRRALDRGGQGIAKLAEAAPGLAAAGRTDQDPDLHGLVFAQRRPAAKQLVSQLFGLVIFCHSCNYPATRMTILLLA